MSGAAPGALRRSVAERQADLEAQWESLDGPAWAPRRLEQFLDVVAGRWPDRPYVVTDDRTWSYAQIREWSRRMAWALAGVGVRPGDHVAVVMGNLPEFVALKYGIARTGAVCVPINFLNRRDELGYILRQSDAVVLVTMDRFRGVDHLAALDQLAGGWEQVGGGETFPSLRKVVVVPTGESEPRADVKTLDQLVGEATPISGQLHGSGPDATADILYTSGTTGQPKGVLLTHDMLLRTAYGSAYARAFEDGHRVIFSLPMYHVYGYVEGMLSVPFVAGAIIPQLAFDAAATLRAVARHRATDALFIPTMTMAVLDELDAGDYDLSSLTSVISSGGISPSGLWERIERRLGGVELTTGYGMSETTASTTVTRPEDPPERRRLTNGRLRDVGRAGGSGPGGHLVVYRVADPATGAEVAAGEIGELTCRGPGVTAGYYRKLEETARTIDADGWLHTGDLGRIDADGYLTLVGRLKEVYRCGGEQVMPKEVEDVLSAHPTVAVAHVVPIPDQRMGEVGVAWVVAAPGSVIDPAELVAWCDERLARFKVPRHVLPVAAGDIPSTPSGRPRKFLLSEMAIERLGAGS